MKARKRKLEPMPSFNSDDAAEKFVETADLSAYDLSGFKPMKFEFESKGAALNMRLPQTLLNAVRARAKAEGMPCARYVRLVLEQALASA
jgi:predicted DNA binding CopG/RHH family protein